MKRILPFLFIGLVVAFAVCKKASAQSYSQSFETDPVSQEDGDTMGMSQVTLSTSIISLISSSETATSIGTMNRSLRRRVIHDTCGFTAWITTNTVGTSTTAAVGSSFDLTGSSSSATSLFTTYNKAAIYGYADANSLTGCIVTILRETNLIP